MNVAQWLPACEQVMHELFYSLDERQYDRLAGLFADSGVWHRQGEILSGHRQILGALAKRPATQRIRHIISNTLIESQTPEMINVVSYMTAYRFDNGIEQNGMVRISRPFRISVIRAAMRTDSFKIVEMTMNAEFDFVADAVDAGSGR